MCFVRKPLERNYCQQGPCRTMETTAGINRLW